jgi:hypothetical protein
MARTLHCISIKPAQNGHTVETHWSDPDTLAIPGEGPEKPYVVKSRDELHDYLDDCLDKAEQDKGRRSPARSRRVDATG